MKMKNLDIRKLMEEKRVKGYEVAIAIGVAETSFSRMLCRREMSEMEKEKVIAAINSFDMRKED